MTERIEDVLLMRPKPDEEMLEELEDVLISLLRTSNLIGRNNLTSGEIGNKRSALVFVIVFGLVGMYGFKVPKSS